MHKYEVMFIIRTDTPEEEIEKVISQMENFAVGAGAKMEKVEKLGRRRLAYRINRYREGYYVLFIFEGEPRSVTELEHRMKVTDSVIKFLTVRVDLEQKRAAKLRQFRAKKAPKPKRAAAPAHSAAPSAEAPQA
ncbi:MAG: 30S ribosomal protein S6 [Terriglobia bacterium]